jgi:hypothetical protein
MRTRCLLIALAALAAGAPARAVDYSKIDRTTAKEPAYKQAPRYALLLFGPDAKLRVWVVLDGQAAYIDRNADGDLTGPDERFDAVRDVQGVEIADPDGKTRYRIGAASTLTTNEAGRELLVVDVSITGPLAYRQYCGVELRGRVGEARVAHFHGPLTIGPQLDASGKVPADLRLATGEPPEELYGHVGTISRDHGCWVVVRSHDGDRSAFPAGMSPVVDVEFPAKAPGGASVRKRYPLDKFC